MELQRPATADRIFLRERTFLVEEELQVAKAVAPRNLGQVDESGV